MARPVTLYTLQWGDLSLETVCQKAKEFGYDGVELGLPDHVDVRRTDTAYYQGIKDLLKKNDTLENWKPFIKYGTHYSDTSYRSLSAACERNGKNLFAVQSDAEVFIAARFGCNASKLVIIPDVETYEPNRYGNVRLAKAEIRKPLYVSESFNYARFDVLCKGGHMQWELVDGKLCDYESPNI